MPCHHTRQEGLPCATPGCEESVRSRWIRRERHAAGDEDTLYERMFNEREHFWFWDKIEEGDVCSMPYKG